MKVIYFLRDYFIKLIQKEEDPNIFYPTCHNYLDELQEKSVKKFTKLKINISVLVSLLTRKKLKPPFQKLKSLPLKRKDSSDEKFLMKIQKKDNNSKDHFLNIFYQNNPPCLVIRGDDEKSQIRPKTVNIPNGSNQKEFIKAIEPNVIHYFFKILLLFN